MRILLVDDEHLALELLEIKLKKFAGIEIVGKFTNPEKVIDAIANVHVDVVFLDMEMGSLHGLVLAEEIMNHYSHIQIVFVTAFPQFALDAFEVNALDYLLKPVCSERLAKTIRKINERLTLKMEDVEREKVEARLFVYAMSSFKLVDMNQNIIKWRTRKVQELFIFLWHQKGEPVHKARVVEELWPNMPVSNAIRLMHTTVYQLRKTLREIGLDRAIQFVNDHYVLTSHIASDAEQLEKVIDSNRVSAKNIEKVLELFRGEYLVEENYQWSIQEQQDLTEKTLYFLEEFILKEKNNQEHTLLLQQCLEKMVELDEYNERYIVNLLNFYGEMKNIQKLIECYQTTKRMFEEELGVKIPVKVQQVFNQYYDR